MKDSALRPQEKLNVYFILTTSFLIIYFWGFYAYLYVVIAGLSAVGPHPAAIHIIAEHYEFVEGQESYDYIGWWNFFNLNVGYHVEHHDFPTCPWWNLKKIRALAP